MVKTKRLPAKTVTPKPKPVPTPAPKQAPNIVLVSIWMNDVNKRLLERATHLLEKEDITRWVWATGDCSDSTHADLQAIADKNPDKDIVLINHDTGLAGENPAVVVKRKSITFSAALDQIKASDDYVLVHDSDLVSPVDLAKQLLSIGKLPVAGWVTLGENGIFYDTWGYRQGGQMFSNYPPYHAVYNPETPFEVDSVGGCFMIHAEDIVSGVRCEQYGVVELFAKLKDLGRQVWVIPTLKIVQPRDLWVSRGHA